MATSLFVVGASGHAKVVVDILERAKGLKIAFVVDATVKDRGRRFCGYPVIDDAALPARRGKVRTGIVAIGNNDARARLAAWLAKEGFRFASALHPAAIVARDVEIGTGSAAMAGAVINSGTNIGSHVIINTGATVDHDCAVGDFVHIAPGCHLCGGVSIGAGTLLGAGATVIPGVRIGAGVVVGAGSTVIRNVPDGARVAGSPARPIAR